MDYSELIRKLTNWITDRGFTVELVLDREYGGSTDYQLKTVVFNHPKAKSAAIILAHEAGHVGHYVEDPNLETSCDRMMRERHAFARGWWILAGLGAAGSLISFREWREYGIDIKYWTEDLIKDA
jgi:hypothetical protein